MRRTGRQPAATRRELASRLLRALPVLLVLCLAVITVSGCGGCRTQDDAADKIKKKKKEKKKKPDFVIGDLETLPSDDSAMRNFVKPGHVVTASVPALSNNFDFRAEFETSITDSSGRPLLIGDTKYHVVMSRPAALAKGQTKLLESTYFIPGATDSDSDTTFLRFKLKDARTGRVVHEASQITRQMDAYQYLFVVLSSNPNGYGYLKQLDSIRPARDALLDEREELAYYRVVLPSLGQRVPLPTHPFSWSTFAYVLWDGLHPGRLRRGQQQAMLDWLHWGGQLIISGPGSLDQLAGSFLDPYLPAHAGAAVALDAEAFESLNANWSLRRAKQDDRLTLDVQAGTPLVGVQLHGRPLAKFIQGTGQLVAERRVGRGRIVVTAFALTSRNVVNWGSFDSFFNACLLRRPSRRFSANQFGAPQTDWADFPSRSRDPLFVTATRYFARDVSLPGNATKSSSPGEKGDWHVDGCESSKAAGLGGWNDKSGAAVAAQTSLRDAAGISIPSATFVLTVLTVYLVILIPVNWGLFRLIGRVEWAWAAAPVIAIVGAAAVIHLAQLDIGFVRSRTEIAVIEAHGGYGRAHLTRYTALYASLSSSYELHFEDPSAVIRPSPRTPPVDSPTEVAFRRERGVSLRGFRIDSNTTGYVHSEQMYDLGGTMQLEGQGPDRWKLRNNTNLELQNAGVLYRAAGGELLTCWLGRLPVGAVVELRFRPLEVDKQSSAGAARATSGAPWFAQWDRPSQAPSESDNAPFHLDELINLAAGGMRLQPGDVRLVAWIDSEVPGMAISPAASQTRARCVVLVHLRYESLAAPQPDRNLLIDARNVNSDSGDTLGVFTEEQDSQDRP